MSVLRGNTVTVNFETDSLFAALDKMQEGLLSEVRPAAQAGAQVFYDEVKLRAPTTDGKLAKGFHIFYGRTDKYKIYSGALKESIYQVYSKKLSGPRVSTYHISWNWREAPYGKMVEFGTSRAAAHPFLRPAYTAMKERALQAAKDRFLTGAQKAIRGAKA